MLTKTVYQTNHLDLYVGPATAHESPLEPGVFLIPGGCVETPPPEIPEYKAALWRGEQWQLVDTYLGLTAYHIQTRQPTRITRHGPLPALHTLLVPGPGQVWKDGEWVDDLPAVAAALHAEKLQAIQSTCQAEMTGGYSSSALGEPHRYPSELADQFHLTSIVMSGMDSPLYCTDEDAALDYRPHTIKQLRKVSKDFTEHRLHLLQKTHALKQQLDQALIDLDLDALKRISWEAVPQ
jgi:hypothetical protein